MLLGSSLGAFMGGTVSARIKEALLPSVVCWIEDSRGRPSHAIRIEGAFALRASAEEEED